MRRSFRDAIVGFSLIGGVIFFSSSMLWLRGIKIGSSNWDFTAVFKDASGIAERSPVTYRGILVGSVKKIKITPQSVQAKIEIHNKDLVLAKPVFAQVKTNSVLSGDVQVSLISNGSVSFKDPIALPSSKNCNKVQILCKGDFIEGEKLQSISSLTAGLSKIVYSAEKEDIFGELMKLMNKLDRTQENIDELILISKEELVRAKPIITELTQAASHLNNILSAIDNPETLDDLLETASSARSITKKINELSTNIEALTDDKELIAAIRDVTIGLSKFFNDVYK
tara:strand:+ start:2014 stop:2862 length:849 start_codon:yes stop_codon:yes gene_type:complete